MARFSSEVLGEALNIWLNAGAGAGATDAGVGADVSLVGTTGA